MQRFDTLVSDLTRLLVAVKPALDASAVRPDSSLTADLGLDSLDLVELANRLSERYPGVDLTGWLADAVQAGGDRVAGLARYLSVQRDGRPVTEVHSENRSAQ